MVYAASISTATAQWIVLGVCVTAVIVAHIPFRGVSLRDRLRPRPPTQTVGLRLLPGLAGQLTAADITALIDDAPYPVYSLSFHRVRITANNERAHQYFAATQRLHVDADEWMHLIIHADLTPEQAAEIAQFMATRLGHCGLRTRPLLPSEIALSHGMRPLVRIQQADRSLHRKRNYLWMGSNRQLAIPPAPQQVLGIGSDGRALTMRLADIGILTMDGRAPDSLLLPALALGYRVGIRTGSPQHFRTALTHGAVLVTTAVDEHLDVIFYDIGTKSNALSGGNMPNSGEVAQHQSSEDKITPGANSAPAIVVSEPNELSALTDLRLSIRSLTWELEAGEQRTQARPLPL